MKRNSKSALTELLQQNPDSPPLLSERQPEIEILKLISPPPKVKRQRQRALSTESSVSSLPPTPPTTPRTPSKPIKIPYPNESLARLKLGTVGYDSVPEVADEFNSPEEVNFRPADVEGIFQMSPVLEDLTELKRIFLAGRKNRMISEDSMEQDGFEEIRQVYCQERRTHYHQKLKDQPQDSDDSDFDGNPKECFSLSDYLSEPSSEPSSESFNFSEGALSF